MEKEQLEKYNAMVNKINTMSDKEIDLLIAEGKCPFQPELLLGEPMGQFHCNVCGEMVIAGLKHTPDEP